MTAENYYQAGIYQGQMQALQWKKPTGLSVSGSDVADFQAGIAQGWLGVDIKADYEKCFPED